LKIIPPRRPDIVTDDEIVAVEVLMMLASGKDFSSPPSDSQTTTNRSDAASDQNRSGRAHECSICHKVFSTGQALGGHKTTHRNTIKFKSSHGGPPCNSPTPIPAPKTVISINDNISLKKRKRNNNSDSSDEAASTWVARSIDLNLPPEPEFSPSAAII
ncbi:hypothetical protein MIMGU_mgv1a020243mg, partial [Erythranthe guttata]